MRSTTADTISGNGCDTVTVQPPSPGGRLTGVGEISGVWVSRATPAIAIAPGTPEVPISTSTLSSLTSLRALRAAVDGSDASSSTISCTLWPAICGCIATAVRIPFSYGMPSPEIGPDRELITPIFRSAAKALVAAATPMAAMAASRCSCVIRMLSVWMSSRQGTSFHWPFSSLTMTRERSSEP